MLDKMDLKLLALLQRNACLSVAEISEQVGLSSTPCWRRLKRLEEDGYIEKRVALVNARKAGLPMTAFVSIRTNRYDEEWVRDFTKAAENIPEIVEIYDVSGDVDYLMKVIVKDIDHWNMVGKKLLRTVQVADISSAFVVERIKFSTELPLESLELPAQLAENHLPPGIPHRTNERASRAGNRTAIKTKRRRNRLTD